MNCETKKRVSVGDLILDTYYDDISDECYPMMVYMFVLGVSDDGHGNQIVKLSPALYRPFVKKQPYDIDRATLEATCIVQHSSLVDFDITPLDDVDGHCIGLHFRSKPEKLDQNVYFKGYNW